eukprot:8355317-Karenia_brevis.AAC.1
MPNVHSKQSRALANVRTQLKTGKTRGNNPRKLTADEILALEQKATQLQEEIAEARHQRSVNRINSHTTQEAEQTRAAVHEEGQQMRQALQPIIALVAGEGDTIDDRLRIKRNQIALLRASVREDLAAKRHECKRVKEERAEAALLARKVGARVKRPRVADDQTTLALEDEPVEQGQPEEEDLPEPAESDLEEQAAES